MHIHSLRRVKAACFSAVMAALLAVFSGCTQPAAVMEATMYSMDAGTSVQAAIAPYSVTQDVKLDLEDHVTVLTAVPAFTGFPNADTLTVTIEKQNEASLSDVKQSAESDLPQTDSRSRSALEPSSYFYQSFYDYSQNGNILSVVVTYATYTGGAHGYTFQRSHNIDLETGSEVPLQQLFKDPEAAEATITQAVLTKLEGYSFEDAETVLAEKGGDYTYYLDGRDLVVYFDPYEIAPYAYGIPEFRFDLTKMETTREFENLPPSGVFRLNGQTDLEITPVFQENILLPLVDVLVSPHKLEQKDDGTYLVDGAEVTPTLINGQAYMPMEYYTNALDQLIIYDGKVIRAYSRSAGLTEATGSEASSVANN